jgi:hypothetical protein
VTLPEEVWMDGRTPETGGMVESVLAGESATAKAAHASLEGKRKGLRGLLPFLGPAFVAAIAYIDPGNFATNISAGAQFGYLLLWVILASNLMAMLIQSMSAKLEIATREAPTASPGPSRPARPKGSSKPRRRRRA